MRARDADGEVLCTATEPVTIEADALPELYVDMVCYATCPTSPGIVDRVLAGQDLERRIALRVPHFSSALIIVAQSDLVLTAPSSLSACPTASTLACQAAPLELPDLMIGVTVSMR